MGCHLQPLLVWTGMAGRVMPHVTASPHIFACEECTCACGSLPCFLLLCIFASVQRIVLTFLLVCDMSGQCYWVKPLSTMRTPRGTSGLSNVSVASWTRLPLHGSLMQILPQKMLLSRCFRSHASFGKNPHCAGIVASTSTMRAHLQQLKPWCATSADTILHSGGLAELTCILDCCCQLC
jgi:hypothetical protein